MKIDLCKIYIDVKNNKDVKCPNCKDGKLKSNRPKSPYVIVCDNCDFKIHSC